MEETLCCQGEVAGASLRAKVEDFFITVAICKVVARENRMRLNRELAERIANGTEDDEVFELEYEMAQNDICGCFDLIETSHNPDSLLDALLTHRMFFLCSDVIVAQLYLKDFEMACVETNEEDALYRSIDGRKELVVCTSCERTMELIEESESRGDHLFIPTSAGAA